MAVFCPRCEMRHPSEAVAGGATLLCACGARVGPPGRSDARTSQRTLAARADALCRMILSSEWPDIDVVLERERVRALAAALFPDRMDLYDMVYESRFDRLWEQFRSVVARGEEGDADAE